jgi:hypothetical protein
MLNKKIGLLIATLAFGSFTSVTASAQVLWSALQTKPKPNMIVAYDVSTTSQISPTATPGSCGSASCHATWGGWSTGGATWTATRLQQATTEMLTTLNLFRNDFVYGGLRYDTCGPWGTFGSYDGGQWAGHCPASCVGDCYDDDGGWTAYWLPSGATCSQGSFAGEAEVSFMTPPDDSSVTTELQSYNNVVQMITDIATYPDTPWNVLGSVNPNGPTKFLACEHGEGHVPGQSGSVAALVPTGFPGGVTQFIGDLIVALGGGPGAVPGLSITGLPTGLLGMTCDPGTPLAGQTISSLLNLASVSFPTPGCHPSIDDTASICAQINAMYAGITSLSGNCFDPTLPANAWLAALPPPVCDANMLSSGTTLCGNCGGATGTVFHATCVCDSSQPGCLATGVNTCGLNWQYRSRQQLAICAAGDNTPETYPTFGNTGACSGGVPVNPCVACDLNGDGKCKGSECSSGACGACDLNSDGKCTPSHGECAPLTSGGCTSIGYALRNQPDNIVRGGAGACRENAVIFVTDGFAGDSGGVQAQAEQVAQAAGQAAQTGYLNKPFYSPINGVSNAWVFNTAPAFGGAADPMAVSLGQTQALPATDQITLNTSFAKVLNRVEKGHFFGSNISTDAHETRVAVMSTSVPGHYAPGGTVTYPDERYFGHPTRITWYAIDTSVSPPTRTLVCETDWKSRAPVSGVNVLKWDGTFATGISNVSNGPLNLGKEHVTIGPPAGSTDPAAAWLQAPSDPGVSSMYAEVPDDGSTDRGIQPPAGGVGAVGPYRSTGIPATATGGSFVYGYMLNGGSAQPVIVEAPHDVPVGLDAQFLQFENSVGPQQRPRVIYSMAGGWLFAHNGGNWSNTAATVNGVHLNTTYDDNNPSACTEMFRFIPSWTDSAIQHAANIDPAFPGDSLRPAGRQFPDLLRPQHYTEGQIAVREARIHYSPSPPPVTDFATVLVMTQGWVGPNFSVLDVTNPTAPAVIGEGALPAPAGPLLSNYTTAEPTIYSFPNGTTYQTVVVFTGGDGGDSNLYSFRIDRASGVTALDTVALPAGNYPSSAVCFDGTSAGTVTDCVVLSDLGKLVRVRIDRTNGHFGVTSDLSTGYAATFSIGASERFYTHPAVFFEPDGAVSYVFGSGDIKKINEAPDSPNFLYKVKERNLASSPVVNATTVCTAVGGVGTANGKISLATQNEIVTSSPIVARGVVGFTTFTPPSTGCGNGTANLYAMTFSTCFDAAAAGSTNRPAAQLIGNGIPMSPSIARTTDTIVVQTTAQQPSFVNVNGSGSGLLNKARNRLIPLYWRPEMKAL